MTLRSDAIEVLTSGPAGCSCRDATCNAERLDKLLDLLTERADEWREDVTLQQGGVVLSVPGSQIHQSFNIEEWLAVLREGDQ